MNLIRLRKQREMLRIGYRDIAIGEPLDRITQSISDLADALCEAALQAALRRHHTRHGIPRRISDQQPAQLVIFGLGKLGGRELNYSSDIDLLVIFDESGRTDGAAPIPNDEFFAKVVQDVVRYLSAQTAKGWAYRVDLRLRPFGKTGPLCLSAEQTMNYYDRQGRTWERQALIKARVVAGDLSLGKYFLAEIADFVYRTTLSAVEINEIKALKREMEAKAASGGKGVHDLKTGYGGLRDIEFVIQFLQLLHGGQATSVRSPNTLSAMRRLVAHGGINQDEHTAMETAYRFLRKLEHRLQFMFDRQTHRLPESPAELQRLALRVGYSPFDRKPPGEALLDDLRAITDRNRATLHRLLDGLFGTSTHSSDDGQAEFDLILMTEVTPEDQRAILAKYRFKQPEQAYSMLMKLAEEEVPFLSSIRCRHFLSGLVHPLLKALAETPDPDLSLRNLVAVSSSLGAKGVLWESCSVNPAMLKLVVDLCSQSQMLCDVLIKNPGMIDELLDSLVFNHRPTQAELSHELDTLMKGADDVDLILHSFKSRELLEIGTLDVTRKSPLLEVFGWLSDLADTILSATWRLHFDQLSREFGVPISATTGKPVDFALIGLGKLGGREINYQSDLDLLFIFGDDGYTQQVATNNRTAGSAPTNGSPSSARSNGTSISAHEFFTRCVQAMTNTIAKVGPLGQLYKVDWKLRPTGKSGTLVVSLNRLDEYYRSQESDIWERQALTRGRVIFGSDGFKQTLNRRMKELIVERADQPDLIDRLVTMRRRLEESATVNDLKRGFGGVVDIEFAVQLMQIRYGKQYPEIMVPNLLGSIRGIESAGLWTTERCTTLIDHYLFLRLVKCRLGVVLGKARPEIPIDLERLSRVARHLGFTGELGPKQLLDRATEATRTIRQLYLSIIEEERAKLSITKT